MSMCWPCAARCSRSQQRGEDRAGRVHAGEEVGHRHADLLRSAAGQVVALAGDAHQPAQALDHEVVARAGRGTGPSWPKPVIEQ